ncbi:MAG: cytochrome P450 [Actinobacteria bacterium]|nr:cytochrome P450 [Actinomycetota bacterium]
MTLATFDPLDPAFHAGRLGDPHECYARLRAESPVEWNEAASMWTVAKHEDVMAISRDPATFCSGRGVLPTDRARSVAGTDSILFLDPPEHQRHRRLVTPAFTPKRVAGTEPVIRRLTRQLLDALPACEPVEFVDAVAAPLPLLVIAEMLGIPGDDRDRFRIWSDSLIAAATDPDDGDALVAAAELWEYFQAVIEDRRAKPGDDLVSVLVTAEVANEDGGEPLSAAELLGFCMSLLVAGNETTRNLFSGGMLALAEHPDQCALLVADPSLVPTAVEEMLRWVTPVLAFARTATRAVELRGQHIAEGDYVLMLYASANRDKEVFGATGGAFDVTRDPNPHVAFGFGEHFCLGASLARLEARVFFEELLARFASVRLAGDPQRLDSVLMHGLVELPLVLAPE